MQVHTKFFGIYYNGDRTEGKGPLLFTGIGFVIYEDALMFVQSPIYANEWGVMGTLGSKYDVKETSITVYSSFQEGVDNIGKHLDSQKKIRALAKLTKEERDLLGL